jgi:hypothetical protein
LEDFIKHYYVAGPLQNSFFLVLGSYLPTVKYVCFDIVISYRSTQDDFNLGHNQLKRKNRMMWKIACRTITAIAKKYIKRKFQGAAHRPL